MKRGAPVSKKGLSTEKKRKSEEEVATKKEDRKNAISREKDRRSVENDSSDSDDEDAEFVTITNLHGDAHGPREEEHGDSRREIQTPQEQNREESTEERVTGIDGLTEKERTDRPTSNE